ncbi:MAG: ATP-binding domain-containing protein [Anaerolineales bacterium]|nr:ATP-binding domain-containing protein [Anaerolineales bacterium]
MANWKLSATQPAGPGEVYCTTVHQYKGMESPVVVLAEVSPTSHQDLDTIMYIGCSRARNHLVIVADAALPPELQARLPAAGAKRDSAH